MHPPEPPSTIDSGPAPAHATRRPAARQATLREHNLALVAHTVRDAATPPSRAAVSEATGLTRATVSSLVDRLIAAGVLAELPPQTPHGAGRPAVPLIIAARTLVGLGLEVNVDYLGVRAIDLTGEVVAEHITPGDFAHSDPDAVLGQLGHIAGRAIRQVTDGGMRIAGGQLAVPGLVDRHAGMLRVAPNLGWTNLDPVPPLGLDLTVAVANEAKLAALAQADTVPRSYIYVSGDVGIGSALVIDGSVVTGDHGWAGEIGHVMVDPAGPPCGCGSRGCLEQFAGKDALLAAAGLPPHATDVDLIAAAQSFDGSRAAHTAVEAAATALGSALGDYINLVDVSTIVLGGIYSPLAHLLTPTLRTVLQSRVLAAPWVDVAVLAAPVSAHAALTGGARAVLRRVVDNPSGWIRDHLDR